MARSPETSSFSSFADASKAIQINARRDQQERFDQALRGKFKRVAAGNFTSHLPGVKSITIVLEFDRSKLACPELVEG